ncbi:MAG: septal ring lytic transglycosylase RlpA family protein [Pseudomonadota bacterium]
MRVLKRLALISGIILTLAACATQRYPVANAPRPHYKIGKPYTINGRTYTPKVDPRYNRVGLASWYGPQFHGRPTANGEIFDKNRISAAHQTLPLPSIVEVRNLENGRRLFVRVNDRGPFVGDRIIDLSEAAARSLGFKDKGLAKVQVRYVRQAALYERAPSKGQTRVYSFDTEKTRFRGRSAGNSSAVRQASSFEDGLTTKGARAQRPSAQAGQSPQTATRKIIVSRRASVLTEPLPQMAPIASNPSTVTEPSPNQTEGGQTETMVSVADVERRRLSSAVPSDQSAQDRTIKDSVFSDGNASNDNSTTSVIDKSRNIPLIGAAVAPISAPISGTGTSATSMANSKRNQIDPKLWIEIGTFDTFDGLEVAQDVFGSSVEYAVFDAPDGENRFHLEAGPFPDQKSADAFLRRVREAGYGAAKIVEH